MAVAERRPSTAIVERIPKRSRSGERAKRRRELHRTVNDSLQDRLARERTCCVISYGEPGFEEEVGLIERPGSSNAADSPMKVHGSRRPPFGA